MTPSILVYGTHKKIKIYVFTSEAHTIVYEAVWLVLLSKVVLESIPIYMDLSESDPGFEGNVVQGSWTKGHVYGKSAI